MPPCTIPNSAAGLPACATLLRRAQRRLSSIESRACSGLAGYGVHSSKTITTSEPSSRCTRIEVSGSRNTALPSTGERNRTPLSLILRMSPRLNTWKPPESVSIGRFHPMKACRSPRSRMMPEPGRSIRWKVLPSTICAPASSRSRGSMPLTVP